MLTGGIAARDGEEARKDIVDAMATKGPLRLKTSVA